MAYVVGLMSGTSLDGLDAALVKIDGCGLESKVQLLHFLTIPYSEEIQTEIHNALSPESSSSQQICSLNFKLGQISADAVITVCKEADFSLENLDLIGSHGQTIYHQPSTEGSFIPSTLQIGEPAVIAHQTHTTVVSNFRTRDMAAGGQGAPLVPYTELILYGSKDKSRLLQNIGGIGNVTVLPKRAQIDDVFAFDTGPGNMMIDSLCQKFFGLPYDPGGEIANSGVVNDALLEECMKIPFVNSAPPKSTGRELFGSSLVDKLIQKFPLIQPKDFVTTMTMFTAKSIALNYKKYIFPKMQIDEVIVGGGGSYNHALMDMLKAELTGHCRVLRQEDIGHSSEAKEAIAFAILANETMNHIPSNVPAATGAKHRVILGNITPVF